MAKTDKDPAFVKRDPIVTGKEYAQLLKSLKERFRRSQIKAAVKVNTEMVEFYWEMGRGWYGFYNQGVENLHQLGDDSWQALERYSAFRKRPSENYRHILLR